jgi:carbon-monoxide dehydrogenase large subunit
VVRPEEASRPGAPLIHDEAPGNVALDYHFGDSEQVAAAFAKAAHVTRLKLSNSRVVVNAMEPRAAIGIHDPRADASRSRALAGRVRHEGQHGGDSQGRTEAGSHPDRSCRRLVRHEVGAISRICLRAACRARARPSVKWTDERSGSFVSDSHGRDHELTAELALDADGTFLALRITNFGNMGGFLAQVAPMPSTLNTVKNVQSVYRTPLIEVSTKCMFTNTSHVSAYRGAGRPEGNYYMERLIDAAAAEMGIDRVELRRRNQIRPREIPIKTASGSTYDSGDFPGVLKHALEVADVEGFARRKRESRKRGKVRGLGIGSFLEVTAPPSKEMGGIRFEADGTVTDHHRHPRLRTGSCRPLRAGPERKLGIPFERIRLLQGDSDELLAGGGTGGSKSIMHSGTAIVEASAKVIDQGKQIASHVLEAAAADIEFAQGRFVIAGTDRAIGIMELAEKLRSGLNLPEGVPSTLDIPSRQRRPRRVHLS